MKILLTGATGRIGPYVLQQLCELGHSVRVAGPEKPDFKFDVEWVEIDFLTAADDAYGSVVAGADIIIHLAAELWDIPKMNIVNVIATQKLAEYAERAQVRRFVYSSSICVYGFPATPIIDEYAPTLDPHGSLPYPYAAPKYLHDYSITKLQGELVLRSALKNTELVILRFSNVFNENELERLLKVGLMTRLWRGARNSHAIYVGDIAHAVCFTALDLTVAGGVSVFNVSEDADESNLYAHFYEMIPDFRWAATVSKILKTPIRIADTIKDKIKFKSWKLGWPAGRVLYTPSKLLAAGYRYRFGIKLIQSNVAQNFVKSSHE